MEKILSARDVAATMQVSVYTIYELLYTGQLKGFKISSTGNSRWRIRESDLNAYIEKQEKRQDS